MFLYPIFGAEIEEANESVFQRTCILGPRFHHSVNSILSTTLVSQHLSTAFSTYFIHVFLSKLSFIMPPAQLKVPAIKSLLGNPTNAQYTAMKDTFYQLIVNIGCYHLWYYDVPDRERIWTIIFRVVHTILPAVVPDPGPGVAIPRHVLLAVYHLFLCCQKHLLSNHKAMYLQYKNEYDRCSLAGYDVYTCHHRGVYAGNASWAPNNQGNPMAAPSPQFPNLVLPAPNPAPVGLGGYIRKERGPPQANLVPPTSYLPQSINFWVATYPGAVFPANFVLPPNNWKISAENTPVGNIPAVLAALPAPGSLNNPDSN